MKNNPIKGNYIFFQTFSLVCFKKTHDSVFHGRWFHAVRACITLWRLEQFGLELWVLCFCCKVWNICLLFCSVLFQTCRLVMKEIIVVYEIFQDPFEYATEKKGREKSWNNWKQFTINISIRLWIYLARLFTPSRGCSQLLKMKSCESLLVQAR